jgi:EmrB/QacA subfamily drug resistance transporter
MHKTWDASQRAALIAATLASFLAPFMGSATNVALPSISREFVLDAILLGWISTSYLLAAAIFIVPFGRLADIHGRKRIFAYGISLFTVTSLLAAVAPSVPWLILSRVGQGVGSAMIFGTGVAILTSVFPAAERGRLGINVAAVCVGLSLGPFIGGFLQSLGWRSIFAVNVPLGLVALAFVVWQLRGEWAEAQGESFDLVGSVVYAIALLALMVGFSLLPDGLGAILILIGAIGLAGFLQWEMRSQNPVLHIDLFAKNRPFAFSNLAALINYSATSAVTFLLSLYLQYIKALSPQQAGLVLVAQPIVQATFSPLAGGLSDRIEPRIVASVGMALTATGLALLILLNPATPFGHRRLDVARVRICPFLLTQH